MMLQVQNISAYYGAIQALKEYQPGNRCTGDRFHHRRKRRRKVHFDEKHHEHRKASAWKHPL